jgi:predicted nucleic acid-binding protein
MPGSMLVLDASIVVPLIVLMPGQSAPDIDFLSNEFCAPQLLSVEFANAIWKYEQASRLAPAEAQQAWSKFEKLPLQYAEDRELVPQALILANALKHPVYDCIYLALALARGTRVVTRDKRFAAAARASYAKQVELIN